MISSEELRTKSEELWCSPYGSQLIKSQVAKLIQCSTLTNKLLRRQIELEMTNEQTILVCNSSITYGRNKMFSLIKREFWDNAGLIALLVAVIVILLLPFASNYYDLSNHNSNDVRDDFVRFSLFLSNMIPILMIGFAQFQWKLDESAKISSFHLSLPVTRGQLYAAKIVVGIFTVLLTTIPMWLFMVHYNAKVLALANIEPLIANKAYFIITLMGLAAYSCSLLISISNISKLLRCIYFVICYLTLLFIVIYNGLHIDTGLMLVVLSGVSLALCYNKYMVKAL